MQNERPAEVQIMRNITHLPQTTSYTYILYHTGTAPHHQRGQARSHQSIYKALPGTVNLDLDLGLDASARPHARR